MAKVYVVTAPERIRGVYASWPECEAAVRGVPGARYQAVPSREQAEAMLRGEVIALPAGLYGFVDGNHLGGVGAVVVEQRNGEEPAVRETLGLTVTEVFGGAGLPSLDSGDAIQAALGRLRNVLAELGGLYVLLKIVPEAAALTVVHDYEGIGAWMAGRWRTKDPTVTEIVEACRVLIRRRRLAVSFRRQPGHVASWTGRDDFAVFNAKADALARDAVTAA